MIPTPITVKTTTTDPVVNSKCGTDLPWTIRPFSDSCYHFSSKAVTMSEAEVFCVTKNSNLVSITTYEEQAYIQSNIESGRTYWLGARRYYFYGWTWIDQSPFIFTNWVSMMDTDALTIDSNTGAVISTELNNQWNAAPYSSEFMNSDIKYNFICKKKQARDPSVSTSPAPTTPSEGYYYVCDGENWLNNRDNCYKYMNKRSDHKTFDEAKQACKDDSSDLVEVFDESENEFLLTTVKNDQRSLKADITLGCPSGWLMGPDKLNCYKFWNYSTSSWFLAQGLCSNSFDAYLVSIKSKVEQDFILSRFESSIGKYS
jgi:hypothetical protein